MRRRKVFFDTLKKSRAGIAGMALSFVFSGVIFALYGLPLEPFLYADLLILLIGAALFICVFAKENAKAKEREQMMRSFLTEFSFPPAQTLAEADLLEIISLLKDKLLYIQNEYENARQEDADYYTAFVHQIKTPISVMRMEIGGKDQPVLETELFRIEQYANMVLSYLRLGGSDLLIKEYMLDELIRESIRKFAPQFVHKKLKLCYDACDVTLITDKKWFCCILEQFISNALKYTNSGSISIKLEDEKLKIEDTGIGIAKEDIPRIFEKGFTGNNGRTEKRSSGLGLYLCKKASLLLNLPLSAESTVHKGSVFCIDLSGKLKK